MRMFVRVCVRVLDESECPWIIGPNPVKYTLRFLVTAFLFWWWCRDSLWINMEKSTIIIIVIIINKKSAGNQRDVNAQSYFFFLNHIISRDKKQKQNSICIYKDVSVFTSIFDVKLSL